MVKKETELKNIMISHGISWIQEENNIETMTLPEPGNTVAQKLEEENRELMVFFRAMDEVFFSVDMVRSKVIQISQACEKLYGYKKEDFLNDYLFWFGLIHPEDKHIIRHEGGMLRRGEQVN